MMNAFEIRTQQGRLLREYYETDDVATRTAQIESELSSEPWYEIKHHQCFHDEGLPCNPWQVMATRGVVPE